MIPLTSLMIYHSIYRVLYPGATFLRTFVLGSVLLCHCATLHKTANSPLGTVGGRAYQKTFDILRLTLV